MSTSTRVKSQAGKREARKNCRVSRRQDCADDPALVAAADSTAIVCNPAGRAAVQFIWDIPRPPREPRELESPKEPEK